MEEKLNVANKFEIKEAYRLGNREKSPYLATFNSSHAVSEILRNSQKLKGTNIFIQKDLPIFMRQRRSVLSLIKRKLHQNCKNLTIYLRDDILTINDQKFTWDENNKLLRCGVENGMDIIQQMFNYDIQSDINAHIKRVSATPSNQNTENN